MILLSPGYVPARRLVVRALGAAALFIAVAIVLVKQWPAIVIAVDSVPVTSDEILLVLKTGATEINDKLPAHLNTTFSNAPHTLIVSDFSQTIGGHQVHDILREIPHRTRRNQKDFSTYRRIHAAASANDAAALAELGGQQAWSLDRWKFVPMLHKAVEVMASNPSLKWLVIIEADSAVSMTNLVRWLSTKNPDRVYYLGSRILYIEEPFGHGGSGIVLSRKAAARVRNARATQHGSPAEYDRYWEKRTVETPYGDLTLSLALKEAAVHPVTQSWPMTQGESPSSIDWANRMYCEMNVFWHHVSVDEIERLGRFESQWGFRNERPSRFRDVFAELVEPNTRTARVGWDNGADDKVLTAPYPKHSSEYDRAASTSARACAEACEHTVARNFRCVQWMFAPGLCRLSQTIRLGASKAEEHGVVWHAGWNQDGMRKELRGNRFKGCAGLQ